MTDEAAPPSNRPERPKRGPIRKAYTALYALFFVALMSSISVQVTLYVLFDGAEAEAQVPADARPDTEAGQQCTQELRGLYKTLKTRGDGAFASAPAPADAKAQWHAFATKWQRDMTKLSARCRFRSSGMKPVRTLAKDLERLEAAYSTAIDGYTQIGQRPHLRLKAGFAALLKK
ncbi:MAG: hypothetical protein ACI9U2_000877 [Bradymonadia bacterium]